MNPLSQFERLVERVLEDELPKRLGGRLDPAELTIAIDDALARATTPPAVVTIAVATRAYERLAPILPSIEWDLRRHLEVRLAERWPVARGRALVRIVADAALAPRETRVSLADSAPNGASPTRALTVALSAPPTPSPVALSLHRGGEPIHVATLPFTIGRDLANDYVLDHSSVSRFHAELRAAGQQIVATDLGSTNGVFVNRRRITAPTALRDGAQLTLGAVTMTVRLGQRER